MPKGKLIILCGASGSGKTTLLNAICSCPDANALLSPKYSDREPRSSGSLRDDITHVEEISLEKVDFAYVMNGNSYGIRIRDIENILKEQKNPVLILSDFRTIRRMKEIFQNRVRVIYLASNIDDEKLRTIQDERSCRPISYEITRFGNDPLLGCKEEVVEHFIDIGVLTSVNQMRSTELRVQKIQNFHFRYIENLPLFDHVIINIGDGRPEEMTEQLLSIIGKKAGFQTRKTNNLIFALIGAPGSGKQLLLRMLRKVFNDRENRKIQPPLVVLPMQDFIQSREDQNWNTVAIYIHKPGLPRETDKGEYLSNYIKNIAKFNHVLLNSTSSEDLLDQILNLLEHYRNFSKRNPLRFQTNWVSVGANCHRRLNVV